MVIFSVVVDGGQCKGSDGLVKLFFRILVYDIEIGSFCYFKFRINFKVYLKFFQFIFRFFIFEVDNDQFGVDCYLGWDYYGVGLGNFLKMECL